MVGVSRKTVHRRIWSGKLPATKLGHRTVRVTSRDLAAVARERRVAGAVKKVVKEGAAGRSIAHHTPAKSPEMPRNAAPAQSDDLPMRDGDHRRESFAIVEHEFFERFGPALHSSGVAVYCVLALHANSGYAPPVPSSIAAQAGCSISTLSRALQELERHGLISRERINGAGSQASYLYELNDIQSLATPTPRIEAKLH